MRRPGLVLLIVFLPVFARAASSNPPHELLHIGHIWIERGNVFDLSISSQNRVPYTWANEFHVVTLERYVRRELLFKEGDIYDPVLLKESERLLRSRPIFRRATVRSDPPVNGSVDVHVRTDDVWTTSVDVGYGTAGGKNFYRLGALEHNFLGTGHRLGAFVRQDIDRFIRGGSYEDPHLFGTRWNLFGGYGKDQKGQEWEMDSVRLYDCVLSPYSAGVTVHSSDDEDRLFENGDETAFFQHKKLDHRVFASMALDPTTDRAHRVGLAYETQKDRFSDVRLVAPEPVPLDRRVAGVLATYGYFQNDYEKKVGLYTFDREEDINFGWDLNVEAGPEVRDLGSTREGLLGHGLLSKFWRLGSRGLFFTGTQVDGRLENDRVENGIWKIDFESLMPEERVDGVFSVRGQADLGKNLPAETQFLLGGENGLRAYSVRQFSGNRKLLFTAENRWNLWYDWLQLVNIGWAAFADTGGAWHEGEAVRVDDFKSDIGAGVRFAPSRSYSAGLIRADVAYAMNGNDRHSRWTINIGGELRFGEESRRKFDQ